MVYNKLNKIFKMKNNQNGFTHLAGIIIICFIVALGIGFTSWRVVKSRQKTTGVQNPTSEIAPPQEQDTIKEVKEDPPKKEEAPKPKTTQAPTTTQSTPSPAIAKPKAVSVPPVDCGAYVNQDNDWTDTCFEPRFASCLPAIVAFSLEDTGGPFDSAVRYTIKSKQGSYCLVTWRYTELNQNPSWENLDVTCPYNNSKKFMAALEEKSDFENCYGPLLDKINEG